MSLVAAVAPHRQAAVGTGCAALAQRRVNHDYAAAVFDVHAAAALRRAQGRGRPSESQFTGLSNGGATRKRCLSPAGNPMRNPLPPTQMSRNGENGQGKKCSEGSSQNNAAQGDEAQKEIRRITAQISSVQVAETRAPTSVDYARFGCSGLTQDGEGALCPAAPLHAIHVRDARRCIPTSW
eukprot:542378-Pleurochrysis_carterae.AAC.2